MRCRNEFGMTRTVVKTLKNFQRDFGAHRDNSSREASFQDSWVNVKTPKISRRVVCWLRRPGAELVEAIGSKKPLSELYFHHRLDSGHSSMRRILNYSFPCRFCIPFIPRIGSANQRFFSRSVSKFSTTKLPSLISLSRFLICSIKESILALFFFSNSLSNQHAIL